MLEFLFNKVAGLKETPTQVFPVSIAKFLRTAFFYRTSPMASSRGFFGKSDANVSGINLTMLQ